MAWKLIGEYQVRPSGEISKAGSGTGSYELIGMEKVKFVRKDA